MSYSKQTWADTASDSTPITADRLNHMEDGIKANSDNWDSISQTTGGTLYRESYGDDSTGTGTCRYRKHGGVVVLSCNRMNVTASTMKTLGTLPVGYRPVLDTLGFGYVQGTSSNGQISVGTSGVVSIWSSATSTYFSGSIAFISA